MAHTDNLHTQIRSILGVPIERAELIGQSFGAHLERLSTKRGRFALKWALPSHAAALAAEAQGLGLLQAAGALRVPSVIAVSFTPQAEHAYVFVLSEWLESGGARVDMARLGTALATMHQSGAVAYGLADNNFIGGTPQINGWDNDWPRFFAQRRLRPQVERAVTQGLLTSTVRHNLEGIVNHIHDLLGGVVRQPALLHGDLWGGNVVAADANGTPALIDPAVYYGDREAELAFTELFGGFSSAFYAAYNQAWPLEPGYLERRDLYNLYHVLNHLNLFGRSYSAHVEAIAQRYAVRS